MEIQKKTGGGGGGGGKCSPDIARFELGFVGLWGVASERLRAQGWNDRGGIPGLIGQTRLLTQIFFCALY